MIAFFKRIRAWLREKFNPVVKPHEVPRGVEMVDPLMDGQARRVERRRVQRQEKKGRSKAVRSFKSTLRGEIKKIKEENNKKTK